MDVHPIVSILALIVPFTIVSGLAYFLLVFGGNLSAATSVERSVLFAFRHGLNAAIMWAIAFDVYIFINPYQGIANVLFYIVEFVIFIARLTDTKERYLHFVVATSSIVVILVHAIIHPFVCDRSADMAVVVFAHEVLRYILALMIL